MLSPINTHPLLDYNTGMRIILTHEQADFDAIASQLAAFLLDPEAVPVIPNRMNRNVRAFLTIYGAELPFLEQRDLPGGDSIEAVCLVDTQSMITVRGISAHTRVHAIDHHSLREDLPAHWTFAIDEVGATTTLLLEELQRCDGRLSIVQASLLLLGIYEDTGSLTRKRMETCDTEFVGAAKDFIQRAHKAEKPFFVWLNTTWMHFRVHPPKEILGQAGRWQSFYHDAMVEHDKHVGQMLDLLDELGIAKETIVMYSTDNGPHMNTWPDGAMTPFRNEKNSNWEGAFRVPMLVRWPGKIKAGTVSNEIIAHQDWLPTLLAAAGEPEIGEKLKQGHAAGEKTFKVHLDGYNFLPHFTGKAEKGPRPGFVYFSDDGDLVGLRYDNWKFVFAEQRCVGTVQIWAEPFVFLRIPKIFNLRTDPFERADITSNTYWDWMIDRAYLTYAAQFIVKQFLETFKEFPPRMKAASFGIDQVLKKMEQALNMD